MATDEVLFEARGGLGTVTLNRPAALNALTTAMAIAMNERLKAWARDPAIKAVLVRGAAREDGKVPFCAGGDIRALYDGRRDPEHRAGRAFYWHEYRLDRRVFDYPKPYLAFIDGVVMGGGVGISVHGSHRIFTENALFAMPETGIGLFPDVGGSYFLPRLPGRTGFYLGLTGERLRAADALHLGVATQHVPAAGLDALERALIEACRAKDADGAIERALAERRADPGAPPIAARMTAIARAFSGSSVEAICAALDAGSSEWERALGQMLNAKSPTSLKVAFRQMQKGAQLSFDECMRLEYRIALRVLEGCDFYEGIRAIIIDKDGKPRWNPARLEEVSKAAVNAYFAPLSGGELSFED
jgi:enoyl-CoA hydratase